MFIVTGTGSQGLLVKGKVTDSFGKILLMEEKTQEMQEEMMQAKAKDIKVHIRWLAV